MTSPEHDIPNLTIYGYQQTSPIDRKYNCIAWAAGFSDRWWEPDPYHQYDWPEGIPRKYTMEAYQLAYETLGYQVCTDGTLEEGYEKVAIYASPENRPKHAARQLSNGVWTSKLGKNIDIEHNQLESVVGQLYGAPVLFLRRAKLTPCSSDK